MKNTDLNIASNAKGMVLLNTAVILKELSLCASIYFFCIFRGNADKK